MRISRLTIEGFGPYKNREHIDFDDFAVDGLFLITGRTGAGKSSILDAIVFALYASAPRYENGQPPRLRSDYAAPEDPTSVILEFSVGSADYRITRSPEYDRPKARGTGVTRSAHSAVLDKRVDGEWIGVAAKPREVGIELSRILPLSKEQFLQVIVLAQGRFHEFLAAKNAERQDVLRSLFDTTRFERIEDALIEARKRAKAGIDDSDRDSAARARTAATVLELDPSELPDPVDLSWYESTAVALEQAADTAAAELAAADADSAVADTAVREGEALHSRQVRRAEAVTKHAVLAEQEDGHAASVADLGAARRAATVWPYRTAAADALEASAAALLLSHEATEEFAALPRHEGETVTLRDGDGDGDGDGDSSDDNGFREAALVINDVTAQLGILGELERDERRVPGLASAITAAQNSLDEARNSARRLEDRRRELPVELAQIDTAITEASRSAAADGPAAADLDRLSAARTAARQAETLVITRDAADATHLSAARRHSEASSRHLDLVAARLAGHAAELADTLVDGEPCEVCGSTVHPRPATHSGEPVTKDDVEAAYAAVTQASRALEAAQATLAGIARELTAARAQAGERTVGELDAEVAEASAALTAAKKAAGTVADLSESRAVLVAESESLDASLEAQRADAATHSEIVAARSADRDAILERTAQHSTGYSDVAERVQYLNRVLSAARRVDRTAEGAAEAARAAEAAQRTYQAQLAEGGFADEASLVAAHRDESHIARLEADVLRHNNEVAAVSAVLAEPELQDLPHQPVELDPLREQRAAVRSRRDLAHVASESSRSRATAFQRLAREEAAHRQRSAGLLEQYQQLRRLADTVHGDPPNTKRMTLETFVLAARLEDIVAAANLQLQRMTSGRYLLQHDDSLQHRNTLSGLGLLVLDQYSGVARPTHSLSGGETFLASLALALGLSDVVSAGAGGVHLDTLFIDEGFGSLDDDTLAIAMDTLDSLRASGRTIGLISHVGAMKEQIASKLKIEVTRGGWSTLSAIAG